MATASVQSLPVVQLPATIATLAQKAQAPKSVSTLPKWIQEIIQFLARLFTSATTVLPIKAKEVEVVKTDIANCKNIFVLSALLNQVQIAQKGLSGSKVDRGTQAQVKELSEELVARLENLVPDYYENLEPLLALDLTSFTEKDLHPFDTYIQASQSGVLQNKFSQAASSVKNYDDLLSQLLPHLDKIQAIVAVWDANTVQGKELTLSDAQVALFRKIAAAFKNPIGYLGAKKRLAYEGVKKNIGTVLVNNFTASDQFTALNRAYSSLVEGQRGLKSDGTVKIYNKEGRVLSRKGLEEVVGTKEAAAVRRLSLQEAFSAGPAHALAKEKMGKNFVFDSVRKEIFVNKVGDKIELTLRQVDAFAVKKGGEVVAFDQNYQKELYSVKQKVTMNADGTLDPNSFRIAAKIIE